MKVFSKPNSGIITVQNEVYNLFFNCTQLGLKPMAAHGHDDSLSIQLNVNNIPFVIQKGTFNYHTRKIKLRNYFRSRNSYSTVFSTNNLVNPISNMMWSKFPSVSLDLINIDKKITLEGSRKIDKNFLKRKLTLRKNSIEVDDNNFDYSYSKLFIDKRWDFEFKKMNEIKFNFNNNSVAINSSAKIELSDNENDGFISPKWDELENCHAFKIFDNFKIKII